VLAGALEQVEQDHQQSGDNDPKRKISKVTQEPSFSGRWGQAYAPILLGYPPG
jgi:hypothetical protein